MPEGPEASPLAPDHFRRVDESPDPLFYREPRLVTHIDDDAIDALTGYYRESLPAGGRLLDLMSSWVSHLPDDVDYASVTGLGMNAHELEENPRLSERVVQDLNEHPALPFPDGSFDAAAICVSVQYLTRPNEVFAEVARTLEPGAPLIVSFSNRCFPTKAVAAWQMLDDRGHAELVGLYFRLSGGFEPARAIALKAPGGPGDPIIVVTANALPAEERSPVVHLTPA